MHEIRDKGLLLVVWCYREDVPEGRFFWGDGSSPLQWGTQRLIAGETIQPHVHKVRDRKFSSKTIEAFVVLEGELIVDIYGLDKKKLTTVILGAGDFLVAYDGGHGFKSMRHGTKLLEVKLGPFTTVEEDKEKF